MRKFKIRIDSRGNKDIQTIFADDKDKADEVYNILKVYNRDITPLEKYHASF